MKSRLQQFLTAEQLTPARLSEILGIQRSGLSHILSGRNKPGFEFIQKLCLKFPSLNPDWLITGRGKMYKELYSPISSEMSYAQQIENIEQSTENKDNNFKKSGSEPSEIPVNGEKRIVVHEKRVVKMLLIYSDGTFEDFSPLNGE
jgi:transcriptional regulator with XRE-family HTH domain